MEKVNWPSRKSKAIFTDYITGVSVCTLFVITTKGSTVHSTLVWNHAMLSHMHCSFRPAGPGCGGKTMLPHQQNPTHTRPRFQEESLSVTSQHDASNWIDDRVKHKNRDAAKINLKLSLYSLNCEEEF